MKVKFKGGYQSVTSSQDGRRVTQKVEATSLRQSVVGIEYVWPQVGSVLSCPDNHASWLLARHPDLLEGIHDDENPSLRNPNKIVATVPAEPKSEDAGRDQRRR